MGLGMALTEESLFDERKGRIVNPSLAEYHVPVNLDVPKIEIHFLRYSRSPNADGRARRRRNRHYGRGGGSRQRRLQGDRQAHTRKCGVHRLRSLYLPLLRGRREPARTPIAANKRSPDNFSYIFDLMSRIICKCLCKTGSIFAAKAFTSASLPLSACIWKSSTSCS